MNRCTKTAKILFPRKGTDLQKWSVIACDQYTSEPEYWAQAEEIVGDAPSTLRITLPEVYLEQPGVEERISKINATMNQYMADGVLEELPAGMMLLSRDTGGACARLGLVMAFDLEAYEYTPGSASLIRPTEKTVVERIPPRLKIRENAPMELPHIMLLIDNPQSTVIEPVYARAAELEKKYDVEMMLNGGRLEGWFIPDGELTEQIQTALDALCDRASFEAKYGVDGKAPLLQFATGDGNHSMATAKANWEKVKATLSPEEQVDHPARWVLAEVVNIHDESLLIEPIHRVLFNVCPDCVLKAAGEFFAANGGKAHVTQERPACDCAQVFPCTTEKGVSYLVVENSKWALPVASLQAFLDDYLSKTIDARIDYIHGSAALEKLSAQSGNLGFELPEIAKEDLFRGVVLDGVLPRKTFSMGEAQEKRYYMEAKKIL